MPAARGQYRQDFNPSFKPYIDFSGCRIALRTAVAAGRGSHLLLYLAFLDPYIEHAAHRVGIGVEMQGNIGQRGLAALFKVVAYIGQDHASARAGSGAGK